MRIIKKMYSKYINYNIIHKMIFVYSSKCIGDALLARTVNWNPEYFIDQSVTIRMKSN